MPFDHTTLDGESRAATNALLAELRRGRWRPRAWARFLVRAGARSAAQVVRHPRAAIELTVLHAAVLAGARGRGRVWTPVSWALSLTHLGLLAERTSIGPATMITLLRAQLPVLAPGRWSAPVAIALDLADGRLARSRGEQSVFGAYADSLADAAFWTWFTCRYEADRRFRVAALLAWAVPVGVFSVASVLAGRMIDRPHPVYFRPAAAMQAIITVRALRPRVIPSAPGQRR